MKIKQLASVALLMGASFCASAQGLRLVCGSLDGATVIPNGEGVKRAADNYKDQGFIVMFPAVTVGAQGEVTWSDGLKLDAVILAVSAKMISFAARDIGPEFHAVQLFTYYRENGRLGYSQHKAGGPDRVPFVGSFLGSCSP